ncbi:MAG: TolC family protein [Bacteroidales bacterium]|jgi:outer membrane protein|nr:TolC family protein [Bacteroidales bacterium]
MTKMRFTLFLCCFLCVTFRVSAQESWTLEQCIRYAYENNIQLKQQQLEIGRAENDLLQSKLSLLPNLSASGNFNSSKGKVLDQNTFTIVEGKTVNSLSGGISSGVTLFNGLQQKNTIDRNMYSLMASIQNVEKLKNDLSINVTLYYLQIIHAQEQLTVAENQLKLTFLQIERTKIMVDAGSIPEGNLFELQSQAAYEDLQIVIAGRVLELARLNLAQLLDLEISDSFQIVVPDFPDIAVYETAVSVGDVFLKAKSFLPQIKAAESNLKSAEKQLSIAKGYRSPTLSLSGGYNTRYSSSAKMYNPDTLEEMNYSLGNQLKDGINSFVGLGLSIPVFNGWQVQTNVKNTTLNLQNYEYQLQLVENNLYKEIQQAYIDAEESLKKYIASAKAVTSMELAFSYAEQRYETGLINFVDYTTAKTRLTTSQSDLLQAKFEYIFKGKVLDFYNGRPITL